MNCLRGGLDGEMFIQAAEADNRREDAHLNPYLAV
jgi:hypothetical protein